ALDDDLDLPIALTVVREMLRADLPVDERRWLILDADAVLGLDLHRGWDRPDDGRRANSDGATAGAVPSDVQALIDARTAARAARDFGRADDLRRQLETMGWTVVDGPAGTTARHST
ncbi:MAG: cysteine--tRNA ligase, partial [Candidatus Limnocylindrales bacterium]